MKASFILALTLIAGSVFISCKKDKIAYESELEKSYKTFLSFKKEHNNSYRYKVAGSSWIGISWATTITVTNGKVTQRYFKYTIPAAMPPTPNQSEWTEDESQIGTHQQTAAFAPWTLDEVYVKAQNDWLLKRDDVTTYFEAKNNGMLSSCGYWPNNCADDCFRGVSITLIEAL